MGTEGGTKAQAAFRFISCDFDRRKFCFTIFIRISQELDSRFLDPKKF
jgi:hypothetical protein